MKKNRTYSLRPHGTSRARRNCSDSERALILWEVDFFSRAETDELVESEAALFKPRLRFVEEAEPDQARASILSIARKKGN